jgi:hypothetical protein
LHSGGIGGQSEECLFYSILSSAGVFLENYDRVLLRNGQVNKPGKD